MQNTLQAIANAGIALGGQEYTATRTPGLFNDPRIGNAKHGGIVYDDDDGATFIDDTYFPPDKGIAAHPDENRR